MNCTKAIIAIGGYGTRWLPLTKSIEKCMLPVGNRPVIDYIVDDCIAAGIKDVYFVVGEQSAQIRSYYSRNSALETHLEKKGKTKELEQLKQITQKANFHFIVQYASLPYGTAVPVMLFEKSVKLAADEQVIVIMGDQFVHNPDGSSEIAHLLAETSKAKTSAGMSVVHVPRDEVFKYGIVELTHEHGHQFFRRIVEKPTPETAPSTLNNLSLYVFDHDMLNCLQHIKPTNGEYYVTDALNIYVGELNKQMAVVTTKGEYLDCGTVEGWLHANKFMAAHTSK
jgi:UTP--glucose-1-phosphate uridylyltransferase